VTRATGSGARSPASVHEAAISVATIASEAAPSHGEIVSLVQPDSTVLGGS
jgi:hypothetical protein